MKPSTFKGVLRFLSEVKATKFKKKRDLAILIGKFEAALLGVQHGRLYLWLL